MANKGQVMKDTGVKVVLADGKERTLKFDLNALCLLQDLFDDIQQVFQGIEKLDFKIIRTLLYVVLAHEEDDSFSEKDAGALVNMQNITSVADALMISLDNAMPEETETDTQTESGK